VLYRLPLWQNLKLQLLAEYSLREYYAEHIRTCSSVTPQDLETSQSRIKEEVWWCVMKRRNSEEQKGTTKMQIGTTKFVSLHAATTKRNLRAVSVRV
jgi:hypothetical protein